MTLRVRPHAPDSTGTVLQVTPESAGWRHVGFRVVRLAAGMRFAGREDGRETCLVIVSGTASIQAGTHHFARVGGRVSPFEDRAPGAVYLPAGLRYVVVAEDAVELAVCSAPGVTTSTTSRLSAGSSCGRMLRT